MAKHIVVIQYVTPILYIEGNPISADKIPMLKSMKQEALEIINEIHKEFG